MEIVSLCVMPCMAFIAILKNPNSLARIAYQMDLHQRPHTHFYIDHHHMKYYRIEAGKTDSKYVLIGAECSFYNAN